MTDVLDGPLGYQKKRQADPHVSELQAKLLERKKLGLTHGLSDSDDILEDDDEGESEDEILKQYRIEASSHHRRTDRPSSAKRRSPVSYGTHDSGISLGDTLRPGQGNRFMKSSRSTTLGSPSSTQRKSEMPSITSPKQSPKDKHSLYSDSRKERLSPTDSMTYEEKEAIIMNRKTPTKEMQQRQSPVDHSKPWQPPSYRKVSTTDEESGDSPSGLLRGRKTPQDPLLESISETPSPRLRKHSPVSDRKMPSLDRKSPGTERKSPITDRKLRESPKALNLDDPLMSTQGAARPKLKTDVFGSSSTMEAAIDQEPTPKPRKMRFPSTGRKTPTESESLTGRKTPTEKDRFSGRKTPTEKDRFSGRKTPTEKDRFSGRKSLVDKEDAVKSESKSEKRAEPSLMDFLTEDVSAKEKKKKGKGGLFDDDEEEEEKKQKFKPRRQRLEKEAEPSSDSFEALLAKKSYNRGKKPQADESSLCEEYELEPGERKSFEVSTSQSLRSYSKQRSDKQEAEDAIDLVAGEQRTQIKPIDRPGSAKKSTSKVIKPKPRHSLPGTPTPSLTLSETEFNDTKSLRAAIFNEWKKERTKSMIHKNAEEKKKKEEEEKKKKEELDSKRLENELAFKTWKEQKDPVLRDKTKEKLKEEKKKKQEQEQADQKKKEAEKEFSKWKEANDEKLKEKQREKKRAELKKKHDEEQKKREREKDNQSALKVWKARKEDSIKEKTKEEKEKMKQTRRIAEDQKHEQEEEARKKYEKWLMRKDKQKITDKKIKYSSTESVEEKPAWSPASRTIPYGR